MEFTRDRINILIVDDEEAVRNLHAHMLLHVAPTWSISCVESGAAALEYLANNARPDLILCDLNMPDMDGYELLSKIRAMQEHAAIPFILLTGLSDSECQRQGMNLGADDFLTKPVSRAVLVSAINARLAKSQKQREQTQAKLDQLRKSITHSLPHELRTPLVSLRGYADLLSHNDPPMDSDQIKYLGRRLSLAAERLNHLVENYIAYSQIELFASDPVRIASLRSARLIGVKDLVGKRAFEKCSSLDRANRMRVTSEDATLNMGKEYFVRALDEILDNAIKFSKPDSPLTIDGRRNQGFYALSICDEGEGMTQDTIDSLGAFFQFDRAKREQQGSGLGLYLAKSVVELHGGQLQVKSEPGRFTCVTMLLPMS